MKKKIIGSVLSLALFANSAGAWGVPTFGEDKSTVAYGASATLIVSTLGYLAMRYVAAKAVKAMQKEHRQETAALRKQLADLKALYQSLPTEDFREVADRKIEQARMVLEQDAERHVRTASNEFARLQDEQQHIVELMQREHGYLRAVNEFLNALDQRNGGAFVRQLHDTRIQIERDFTDLVAAQNDIAEQLASVTRDVTKEGYDAEVLRKRINSLKRKVSDLEAFVSSHASLRDDVTKAKRQNKELNAAVKKAQRCLDDVRKNEKKVRSDMTDAMAQFSDTEQGARAQVSNIQARLRSIERVLEQLEAVAQHAHAHAPPVAVAVPVPDELL